MFYKISNLKMPVTSSLDEVFSACAKTAGIKVCDILSKKILRKSIDARRKQVSFIYSVLIETNKKIPSRDNIVPIEIKEEEPIVFGTSQLEHPPVIVGFGPCGMFCALMLARCGYNPIVLERGADVDTRTKKINTFWSGGSLDTNTNVQFGEGGAGTFSDGKLTCRNGDPLIDSVLADFVRYGAPEDILYSALPHIGTDILKNVVKSIREEIISLGGKVYFNTAVSDINTKNGKLVSLKLSDGNEIACDVAVFAIGHSARDNINSNSAICINVTEKDFGSHPLSGVEFQRDLERCTFRLGGGSYASPVQTLGDYTDGKKTKKLGLITPSVTHGYEFADLNELFSPGFNSLMKRSFARFGRTINGFDTPDAILTGTETRTSAPVRIIRTNTGESENLNGFYPAGEGAGYAGGIMSAAVDGIKTARNIMKVYKPEL